MALILSNGNIRELVLSGNIDDYPEGIILPVDKPYRWTSADVIRKLKFCACRHFHKKNLKVGQARIWTACAGPGPEVSASRMH